MGTVVPAIGESDMILRFSFGESAFIFLNAIHTKG
jgi:hypothetical protein